MWGNQTCPAQVLHIHARLEKVYYMLLGCFISKEAASAGSCSRGPRHVVLILKPDDGWGISASRLVGLSHRDSLIPSASNLPTVNPPPPRRWSVSMRATRKPRRSGAAISKKAQAPHVRFQINSPSLSRSPALVFAFYMMCRWVGHISTLNSKATHTHSFCENIVNLLSWKPLRADLSFCCWDCAFRKTEALEVPPIIMMNWLAADA